MSHLQHITLTHRAADKTQTELKLYLNKNHDFLKEVARRALGLEQARSNAKAREIAAEDYADHEIRFGSSVESKIKIEKVYFNCTAGYYHSPYIVMETRQGVAVYGRISTVELNAIHEYQPIATAELEAA